MATIGNSSDHCGKPNCDREAEETYEGPNGNGIHVCGMHYYKLVTRGTSETSPLGFGTDITPTEAEQNLSRQSDVSPSPYPNPKPDSTPDIRPDPK